MTKQVFQKNNKVKSKKAGQMEPDLFLADLSLKINKNKTGMDRFQDCCKV